MLAIQELGGQKFESRDIFKDYGKYLCGRRGPYDDRLTSVEDNFECEWGRKPCSADPTKPGKTYCTFYKEDCPVTFLGVYNKATLPEEIRNNRD